MTALVGKYHDEGAERGRSHRVVVAVHPSVKPEPAQRDTAAGPEAAGS
ncbi:hypothetical protein [Actinomadura alba]|nr:hypothetical protein [Actinomadura alba]